MHRFSSRIVVLAALAVAASGCGSSDDTPTTPAPTPSTIVDTFTGTLTLNGAATYSFTVIAPGGITAQLTALSPDPAKPVGLSLGTWNGSICTVPPGLFNDQTIQGSVVVGQTQTVGDFCVRIYDAAGTVVTPQTYTIEVSHQ
jgi:hypothetical protein